MATVTKPLALNESLNSTENTPRNVADILAEELDGIKQAISSQSGSGDGHIIQNSAGANMPQENTMQFTDAHLTDDSVGGKTVIENFKAVTEAEYSQQTEDGAYIITDGDGATIGEASDDYVEVTADGTKTYGELLAELYEYIDADKITQYAVLQIGDYYYSITRKYPNLRFGMVNSGSGSGATKGAIQIKASSSDCVYVHVTSQSSGNTVSNRISNQPTNGTKLTLYYGNRKAVVDLQTTANRCVTSDGGTVQQALDRVDRGSVSVNVTTSMTYAQALASLYSDADFSKLNGKSMIDILGSVFHIMAINQSNQYVFTNTIGSSNALKITEIRFISGTPYLYEYDVYNHSRQDISSANCWKNGTIELAY